MFFICNWITTMRGWERKVYILLISLPTLHFCYPFTYKEHVKVFFGLSKHVCIALFMALHSHVLLLAFLSSPYWVVPPRL